MLSAIDKGEVCLGVQLWGCSYNFKYIIRKGH